MNNTYLETLNLEELNETDARKTEGGGLLVIAFAIGFYVGYKEVMAK